MINRFNVRVYGVLIHENKILLADEIIRGNKISKFPGGGLEFGEGIKDCLIREFKEELDLKINIVKHFYTTDFFVPSIFNDNSQVISIYYLVEAEGEIKLQQSELLSFKWVDADDLDQDDLTLVIDRKVAQLLKEEFSE